MLPHSERSDPDQHRFNQHIEYEGNGAGEGIVRRVDQEASFSAKQEKKKPQDQKGRKTPPWLDPAAPNRCYGEPECKNTGVYHKDQSKFQITPRPPVVIVHSKHNQRQHRPKRQHVFLTWKIDGYDIFLTPILLKVNRWQTGLLTAIGIKF